MNENVQDLFHELANLSQNERERVFEERQIGADMRAEVQALLAFDTAGAESLTEQVSEAAKATLRFLHTPPISHCGPYELKRLLGSGGMGSVYLAERIDGEIQHKVAIKLLRVENHSPVWLERFLKERQLQASLNHPSIARVIDAG